MLIIVKVNLKYNNLKNNLYIYLEDLTNKQKLNKMILLKKKFNLKSKN